ncbi:FAD:protein FMN transferase [Epibacterium sp. MM17-32]|uniref:FAD:protein FMN transferase n=2 Tax=unclassified Epibacterium TaxID=2639179 RepID=UPI001EF653A4|nr:FAD:protein FMN transferase [Epibacterium sp. MM17-32]MCG7630074.1 FAD:protein FMN transferase [Epibacterium sp. MM17-32]
MPLALMACKKGWSLLELSGLTMGTSYSIVAVDHSKSIDKAELQGAVDQALAQVNRQMSNWDAGSEISRFNAAAQGADVAVSSELHHVMQAAQDVHMASDGAFDVTVGALIDLWGFGAGQTPGTLPSEADIAAAMGCCGQAQSVAVQTGGLTKLNAGAEVYLSSIGKGFGVDQVARVLKGYGITDYMVEIGGDLYTAGRNPDGQPWQIGIETPEAFDRGVTQVVGLSDMGMATSGDYRNFFDHDGKRYSHIIDATTGRPVEHDTASVTVLTDNAMLADAWATAMLVLGRERGLEIANQRDMAVLFLDRAVENGATGFTSTASNRFKALTA